MFDIAQYKNVSAEGGINGATLLFLKLSDIELAFLKDVPVLYINSQRCQLDMYHFCAKLDSFFT